MSVTNSKFTGVTAPVWASAPVTRPTMGAAAPAAMAIDVHRSMSRRVTLQPGTVEH
jgi:hypothetical protein